MPSFTSANEPVLDASNLELLRQKLAEDVRSMSFMQPFHAHMTVNANPMLS